MAVWRDLDELKLWERNYNRGDTQQIKKSILRFGFNNALRVWRDSIIMAGNHSTIALRECLADGWTETPGGIKLTNGKLLRGGAVRVENRRVQVDTVPLEHLPKSEAEAFAIADNHIASKAEPDDQILADLLIELKDFDLEILDDIGYTEIEFTDLLDGLNPDESKADSGAQVDRADELQKTWQVERGQLWVIPSKNEKGDHHLLCGDSTNADDVARVMSGEMAALVVTDPPYGVEYADKNKFLNAISRGNRIQTPIAGDHGDKSDIQELWRSAFQQMNVVMRPGAVVYCFMPQGGDQMMMMMMMMGAGIEPRHELIWLKNNHVLGRVDYAYKHEPILYAWKDGGHKFYGDFQTSIIEVDKPQKSDLHPTMKPVELICKLVQNSSLRGELVYEPFGGSGTTMVACEQLSRLSRVIEISPAYCSVILQRMTDLGLEPYRAD